MNFLVKSYGHNHYSAFLLLTIPLSWWQLFSKKSKKLADIVIIFSSYLILFMSLGRISLFISLIQIITIIKLKDKFYSKNLNQKIKSFTKIFSAAIALLLFIFIVFGSFFNQEQICLETENNDYQKICEPISQNERFNYWKTGLKIFKKNYLWGYGAKTFSYAAKKELIEETISTSYAHNIFIHLMAETGIFTSLLLLLIFIEFLIKIKKIKSDHQLKEIDYFLFLAIISSLTNALFDFDFNFFVIFTLTLIWIALIRNKNEKSNNNLININLIFLVGLIINIFFMGNYLLATQLQKTKNIDSSLNLIQTSITRSSIFKQMSSDQKIKERILNKYKNDPTVLLHIKNLGESSTELDQKINLRLAEIDLRSFLNQENIINIENLSYSNQIVDIFEEKINSGLNLIDYKFLSYQQSEKIAQDLVNLAEKNYENDNLIEANQAYLLAIYFKNDILSEKKAIFLEKTDEEDLSKAIRFLKITDIKDQNIKGYEFAYTDLFRKTLFYLFQSDNLDDFYLIVEKFDLFNPQNESYRYDQMFFLLKEILENTYNQTNGEELTENMKIIFKKYKNEEIWKRVFFEFKDEEEISTIKD
jgi:hypothetical protein